MQFLFSSSAPRVDAGHTHAAKGVRSATCPLVLSLSKTTVVAFNAAQCKVPLYRSSIGREENIGVNKHESRHGDKHDNPL